MKIMEVYGVSGTYKKGKSRGVAFVSPEGKACRLKIKTRGKDSFCRGRGAINNKDYPQGVYKVYVKNQEIVGITYYCPEGDKEVISDTNMIPYSVLSFAKKFAEEVHCEDCKCLETHLKNAEK